MKRKSKCYQDEQSVLNEITAARERGMHYLAQAEQHEQWANDVFKRMASTDTKIAKDASCHQENARWRMSEAKKLRKRAATVEDATIPALNRVLRSIRTPELTGHLLPLRQEMHANQPLPTTDVP